MYRWLLVTGMVCLGSLNAVEFLVRTPQGGIDLFEVLPDEKFETVMEGVLAQYEASDSLWVVDLQGEVATAIESSVQREYQKRVTPQEKKDIAFIINTLGMGSLAKIALSNASLKKAGERVLKVHPLRFLQAVFSDEEMKVSIGALQNRGWLWGEFFSGIKSSLDEESHKGNMKLEFVADFAKKLAIEPGLIEPYITSRQWNELIKALITHIPRKNDANRYQF